MERGLWYLTSRASVSISLQLARRVFIIYMYPCARDRKVTARGVDSFLTRDYDASTYFICSGEHVAIWKGHVTFCII